ncbi:MAG: hypothetical protein ACP6IT_10840, partial [Candidatus Thorarchaeota archaeon]
DDDLKVQRLDIPEKENAFYYFELAADELAWPDDEETNERVHAMSSKPYVILPREPVSLAVSSYSNVSRPD